MESAQESQQVLSKELKKFYESHKLEGVEAYLSSDKDASPPLPRFVRLNPSFHLKETLAMLESELPQGDSPTLVPWLDASLGFYRVSGDFKLAQSEVFRSGRVFGMDVSSGAAVAALLTNRYDSDSQGESTSHTKNTDEFRVLDLCCAPGFKLCMIADMLHQAKSRVTVIGVDVSSHRASICKSIVKKYRVHPQTSGNRDSNIRLRIYCADGVSLGTCGLDPDQLVFDSKVAVEENQTAGKRKRMNKSARARERKRLRQLSLLDAVEQEKVGTVAAGTDSASPLTMKQFDRVLVDAECSTDGSLKHIQQRIRKQQSNENVQVVKETNTTLTDPQKLKDLVDLQKGLLQSGFRLLKPGGTLVYSTCSLSREQNEEVIQWLLDCEANEASLVPVDFQIESKAVIPGSIKGTIRFIPNLAGGDNDFFGGGFFLAKIVKHDLTIST